MLCCCGGTSREGCSREGSKRGGEVGSDGGGEGFC